MHRNARGRRPVDNAHIAMAEPSGNRATGAEEPIVLVPHDPGWAAKFERERELLQRTIGAAAPGGIHHVGSTAVPGLDAKPIVDVLVGIDDLDSFRDRIPALGEIGYLYAPYRPEGMLWFCKPDPARREFHLHAAPSDSPRFRDELAFRDRLRADPALARDYAALKHSLAACFRDDREAYTEAKGDFVAAALGGRTD